MSATTRPEERATLDSDRLDRRALTPRLESMLSGADRRELKTNVRMGAHTMTIGLKRTDAGRYRIRLLSPRTGRVCREDETRATTAAGVYRALAPLRAWAAEESILPGLGLIGDLAHHAGAQWLGTEDGPCETTLDRTCHPWAAARTMAARARRDADRHRAEHGAKPPPPPVIRQHMLIAAAALRMVGLTREARRHADLGRAMRPHTTLERMLASLAASETPPAPKGPPPAAGVTPTERRPQAAWEARYQQLAHALAADANAATIRELAAPIHEHAASRGDTVFLLNQLLLALLAQRYGEP